MRRGAIGIASAAVLALAACREKPKVEEPAAAAVQSLAAIVATCASSVGEVQVKRAGGQSWEAVQTGAVFRVGDEVRTGALSFVRVEVLTGGGLELEENASVVIDQAPPEGATVSSMSRCSSCPTSTCAAPIATAGATARKCSKSRSTGNQSLTCSR